MVGLAPRRGHVAESVASLMAKAVRGMAFVPSIGGRVDGTLCKQYERTVSADNCGEFTVCCAVAAWYPGRSSRSVPHPVELQRAPRPFLSHWAVILWSRLNIP